jgi:hypothetical protein
MFLPPSPPAQPRSRRCRRRRAATTPRPTASSATSTTSEGPGGDGGSTPWWGVLVGRGPFEARTWRLGAPHPSATQPKLCCARRPPSLRPLPPGWRSSARCAACCASRRAARCSRRCRWRRWSRPPRSCGASARWVRVGRWRGGGGRAVAQVGDVGLGEFLRLPRAAAEGRKAPPRAALGEALQLPAPRAAGPALECGCACVLGRGADTWRQRRAVVRSAIRNSPAPPPRGGLWHKHCTAPCPAMLFPTAPPFPLLHPLAQRAPCPTAPSRWRPTPRWHWR